MTPQQQKFIKYSAGISIAGVAVYFLFFHGKEKGANGDPTGNGGSNTGNTGYNFNAHKVATDLYELMVPSGYASFLNPNEGESIIEILTPVTQEQFAQVIQIFGKINYNITLGSQYAPPFVMLDKHGLVTWLKTELGINSEFYRTLKIKYPNYL